MAYSLSITQILNTWAEQGVFSYLFPFLIIFAVVFAILQKSKVLGDPLSSEGKKTNVNGINAIIAVSVAFISLLNDYVSTFFATIFPRFGIALSIILVVFIILAFTSSDTPPTHGWLGWITGAVLIIWVWTEWSNMFGGGFELSYFLEEYFWGLILLLGIGGLIYWIVKGDTSQ
jgi:hypothetical protein